MVDLILDLFQQGEAIFLSPIGPKAVLLNSHIKYCNGFQLQSLSLSTEHGKTITQVFLVKDLPQNKVWLKIYFQNI